MLSIATHSGSLRAGAARAALVLTLVTACILAAAPTDIRINEIHYLPPGGDAALEYVELYNSGLEAVDLAGWAFTQGIAFTLPAGTTLPAHECLVVARDATVARAAFGEVRIVGNFTGDLADRGETLRLVDTAGRIIDEAAWDDAGSWPQAAAGRGASLEKLLPRADGPWSDQWAASLTVNGSPGVTNGTYQSFEDVQLLADGATWQYFKGTGQPPAEWAAPGFDASAWLSGPAGFGYADNDDATVLDDMQRIVGVQDGYTTLYIRTTFTADDADYVQLVFLNRYDDGFVAYLNGTEVLRVYVAGTAGTPVAFDAIANTSHEATTVPEEFDISNFASLLVPGENVLAVVGLNLSPESTDVTLAPSLVGTKKVLGIDQALGRRVADATIPRNAEWRYFKGTEEPPAGWGLAALDDSDWLLGRAGFGYADNDDTTVLGDMINNYSTLYVRRKFTVADASLVYGLRLRVDYDDGYIAYLNGTEVARSLNVAGNPTHTGVASPDHEAGTPVEVDLAARIPLLVTGENCLAVMGLNSSLGSSDFSLHPELSMTRMARARPEALGCTVEINEVVPSALGGWIELYNPGSAACDISGYRVSASGRNPRQFALPEGTPLDAGAFLVVTAAELGATIPDAGAITLCDPEGIILVDGRAYAIGGGGGAACARFPDGKGDMHVVLAATQGATNEAPPARGVVINEIMYHPATAPGAAESEWIELLNTGAQDVVLTDWRFTRGIDYAIPADTTIPAGGYLVIAKTPATVMNDYGIAGVIGGYTSGLKNDDELIVLLDDLGNTADRVHYADDGRWPAAADGTGPSLELIHPGYANTNGLAWAASAGAGTPGAANSASPAEAPPLLRAMAHSPVVPTSADSVAVTCEVACPTSPIAAVELRWHVDGQTAFDVVAMLDDGTQRDGAAGDGVYGAVLPPFANGTIVCFCVAAQTEAGPVRVLPPAWETDPTVTMLFQVNDGAGILELPTYRVIMTAARRSLLQSRPIESDEVLDATFIAGDTIRYNVGLRYRGAEERAQSPRGYRIDFGDDEELLAAKRLNLDGYLAWNEHLGMTLFRRADVPAPASRLVRFILNNVQSVPYVHMEAVHHEFVKRRFTGDDEGNLYRGRTDANLDYRGADKDAYRTSYPKRTNKELDDYADIVDLCDKFTNTPDESFGTVIAQVIDVDEWARFFAVHAAASTQESGIARDIGDDYYLYRRPSDGRFVLIPWDLDRCCSNSSEGLFRPTVAAIARFLQHPDVAPRYYRTLKGLTAGAFSQASMYGLIDDVAQYVTPSTETALRSFADARRTYIDGRIPITLTVAVNPFPVVKYSEAWRYFKGQAEPSGGTLAWAAPEFDDSSWSEGPGGFGYGDNDDGTVLDDMLNSYSTVYIRKAFTLEDMSSITQMLLSVNFDDAFVAYLNGVEVARSGAPGAVGVPVPFNALATGDHEAGVPVSFKIANPQTILHAGENVIAVQGINLALTSSDFSLAPTLGLGSTVGAGCPGIVYVSGSRLLVEGTAPTAFTRYVSVNGVDADYDYISGAFSGEVAVTPGTMPIVVEALLADRSVFTSQTVQVTGVTSIGGTLSADTVYDASGSPYLLSGTLTVPTGVTLTVGPGVEFIMESNARISVAGCMQALGLETAPIILDRKPCIEYWGGITFNGTRADNKLVWCRISNVSAAQAIGGGSSKLLIDSCLITRVEGEGINTPGAALTVRNTEISYTVEAISADGCNPAIFEYNYIHNLQGKADCIDPNGCNPAYIRYCLVEYTSDDGIDADNGSVVAIGNEIRNIGDQAISLVGRGNSRVEFNVLHHCNYGVAAKDSHVVTIDHNTIVDMRTAGIRCYEKNAGLGGGHARVRNSIVYFNTQLQEVDALSDATYNYCDLQIDPLPAGIRNFNEDPAFVNRSARNYHLLAGSPCIAAGENGTDVGALPFGDVPLAPTDLIVTGTTLTSISLSWHDVSVNEDGFEVHRMAPGETEFTLHDTLPVAMNKYTDINLVAGETYAYRVRAFNTKGYSDWSNEVSLAAGTIPQAPTNLAVAAMTSNSIAIEWLDNSSDETGFQVWRLAPGDLEYSLAATTAADVATYSDGDPPLIEGGTYRYKVRAYNATGTSGWSNEVVQQTGRLPAAPTNLHMVTFGLDFIRIAWTDNSDNETGFGIDFRMGSSGEWQPCAVVGANVTTMEHTALLPGVFYAYRVRAENAAGVSAWSNVVTQELGAMPEPPLDPSVANVGITWVLLAWQDAGSAETSYEIQREIGGEGFLPLVSLPADTTSYTDADLPEDTDFSYRIRSVNAFGVSAWSPILAATTGKLPAAPENLHATEVWQEWITFRWDDRADNELRFEIQRMPSGGEWSLLIELPPDWETYTDHNVAAGIVYSYRVRAANRFGASEWSNVLTQGSASVPAAPQDVTVSAGGLTMLLVAWENPTPGVRYFEVQHRGESASIWETAGVTGGAVTVFEDDGLSSGETYVFRVRAWNSFGPSLYSGEASGTTGALPGAPANLRETDWSGAHIALAWNDHAVDEVKYLVTRREGFAGAFAVVAELPPDTTQWIDTTVVEGTVYGYVVRAENAHGDSPASNVLTTCAGVYLISITPDAGSIDGGDTVTIEGIHVRDSLSVMFGGMPLASPEWLDARTIRGVTPWSARVQTVDVTAVDGDFHAALTGAFHFARDLVTGDANGNRVLSLADVMVLLDYLFHGGSAPYCTALGDANNDRRLNLADPVFLLQHLFGHGQAPNPPRVDCR